MRFSKSDKQIFRLIIALSLSLNLTCVAAAPERPDAGSTLTGLEERKPPPSRPAPQIEIVEEQKQPAAADETAPKIKVNGFRITGQNIYSEETLLALLKDGIGAEMSFAEMEVLAGKISGFFRAEGYLAASAYLPVQEAKDGVFEIAVVIGQYGNIDIRNNSKLSKSVAAGLLSNLKSGSYIKSEELNRTLLLLADTSGVESKATLVPGAALGTSDLIVELNDGKKIDTILSVDNYGNRFTGRIRSSANFNFNNIGGLGDTFSVGGTYTGRHMNDYSFAYTVPLGYEGLKFNAGYSKMHYSLGDDFASLDANGLAKTTSVNLIYPLSRSRNTNLNANIGYYHKKLQDRIDIAGLDSRKKAAAWTVGLSGDRQDNFHGGGITSFSLTQTFGKADMQSPDALLDDAAAQTAGSYSKTSLNLYRTQYLNNRLNFNLSFTGQLANKNLDSSEKLSLGGANGVRAYPQGEASGDTGYLVSGELRWNMPTPRFQVAAFIDAGRVTLNKNPWYTDKNHRSLAGAGVGLIWSEQGNYLIRLDYAMKLSSEEANSDTDKNGRLWLQMIKMF